uniref:PDEase domain-containing protein n=1 Tax=Entomoneis paludosa TaxID=265537 RepID=A0A7S2Y8F3_9STRA
MSAGKMMRRIVNPDGVDFDKVGVNEAEELHAQTYGLCSDKLMQFAVVFSALIHDVDHTGLTNAELDKMRAPVASAYRHKSIAEQNSVDVAWTVLMDGRFKDLRACIYTNEQELARFRQLIVNAVMATDIADKELKKLRESRWDQAFAESAPVAALDMDQIDSDRKATIVFEYIIQASDVAHTMQHWHTYQKFNRRLFEERYLAWLNGHAGEEDPSLSWYQGEIGFFDFYIIPLARKLEKCGVFGVSSDEYLNYAKENRKEWEIKGRGLVEEMLESCREKYNNILEGSEEHFREEDEDFIDM